MEFPEIDDNVAAVRVNICFRKTSLQAVTDGDNIKLPKLVDAKWDEFDRHIWYASTEERNTVLEFHTKIKSSTTVVYRTGEESKSIYTEYVTTTADTFLRSPMYFQKAFNRLSNGLVGIEALYKRHTPYGYRLLQNHLDNVYYMGMTTWGGRQERIIVTPSQDHSYDRINYNTKYIRAD